MKRLLEILKEKTNSCIDESIMLRRHFHKFPELSFKEHKTSEFIRKYLDKHNINYISGLAGTGIIAILQGGKGDGPIIALRAELDALAITEKTGLEFSSQNHGLMHACGHDAHMAMLLTCIAVLDQMKEEFRGKIIFIFQPGEELVPGGASLLMKEEKFKELNPDLIIAQHVLPELDCGKLGFKKGKYMASSDEIYINLKGKGGHAALPEQSTDQIFIASKLITYLKKTVSQTETKEPYVLGFGKFIANGATNVIPDTVNIEGTLRTFDENTRKQIHDIISRACLKSEKENGIKLELEIRKGYPVLENHEEYSEKAKELSLLINGQESTVDLDIRMSSEDFAFYSQKYPVVFYRLGIRKKGSPQKGLHTPDFDIDEAALEVGIRTMSFLAINFANSI